MVRFRLLCGDFLLPNPAPHLENRMTVCMGYPAMTPQGRAGKRRRKGAGKLCRENGAPNINWSKWPVDVVNDTKRHSPEKPYALRLTSCAHFEHMRRVDVSCRSPCMAFLPPSGGVFRLSLAGSSPGIPCRRSYGFQGSMPDLAIKNRHTTT